MLYPPIYQLLKHIDSRYLLVNVVARRARQISCQVPSPEALSTQITRIGPG